MSVDLSRAKKGVGSVFPEAAIDASGGLGRVEPLLTSDLLISRFLFGIPLISPITKERIGAEQLTDYIKRACAQVEQDAKVDVMPVVRRTRMEFNASQYEHNIWIECPYKPIQKVKRLFIAAANYSLHPVGNPDQKYPELNTIFEIPEIWIDTSYAPKGKIFVNPLYPAFGAGVYGAAYGNGASVLLLALVPGGSLPAFWTLEAVHGFCSEDGQVPVILNEVIGEMAAMMVLLNLFPLWRTTSHALGADGLSQSVSDIFWQLLQAKYNLLKAQYDANIAQIKSQTGNKLFATNV